MHPLACSPVANAAPDRSYWPGGRDGLKVHGTNKSAAMDNDVALLEFAEQPHAVINTVALSVELLLKATKKE